MCWQDPRIGFKTNKALTSTGFVAAVTPIGVWKRGRVGKAKRAHPTSDPSRSKSALASTALVLACLAAGAAHADGDAAKGRAAFVRQCAICHTVELGGDNRFGPNLFGIVGRKAGTAADFGYTNAFKTRANWEWTEDALGGWVMFPGMMVPGTAMGVFQGVAERDRDDLVAYLATLK